MLSQIGPQGEKVVAYFSRTFNKAERRYCVARRELVAIMRAISHFKYYLCGLPFTVRTDHSALPSTSPMGRLQELALYVFTVEHGLGLTIPTLTPCPGAPVLPAAAGTVKRERIKRKSFLQKRSKTTCITESGQSAERRRSSTHPNGERSRNRILICNLPATKGLFAKF